MRTIPTTIEEALTNYKNKLDSNATQDYERERLIEACKQSYQDDDIVRYIFYVCCRANDESFLKAIEYEGKSDDITLFSTEFNFLMSCKNRDCGEIDIYKMLTTPYKWCSFSTLSLRESFIESNFLDQMYIINREGSEFNGWTIHITIDASKEPIIFKITLSKNRPKLINTPYLSCSQKLSKKRKTFMDKFKF